MSEAHPAQATPAASSLVGAHPLFCELRCCRNVVKADVGSESDPYVVMALRSGPATNSQLVPGGIVQRWPTVDDEKNPLWFQTKFLAPAVPPGAFLHISLFDEDTVGSDDLLGDIVVPVERLAPTAAVVTLKIPYHKDRNILQDIEVVVKSKMPCPTKTVFFIRHSISEWNDAQQKKSYGVIF